MEEFLFALFGGILELLGEFLAEIAAEVLCSAAMRAERRLLGDSVTVGKLALGAYLFIVGAGAGLLSALVIPHPLFLRTRLHGISVLMTPLLTGLVMAQIGRRLIRRGRRPTAIETFGYGLAFAFAMALVRFLMLC
ncbi:MAG: hypothetical protein WCE75_01690 [Terracidiphilus sp.]